jgi:hypothetical protein
MLRLGERLSQECGIPEAAQNGKMVRGIGYTVAQFERAGRSVEPATASPRWNRASLTGGHWVASL